MASNPPFNLPGLGNLDQTSGGKDSSNPTTDMDNDTNMIDKCDSGVASSVRPPTSSVFDQRPPGTSTYFSPPLLPPPAGNSRRPSFGITADAGDFSRRSSFNGFTQYASQAGGNGFKCGGTFSGIGGAGSDPNVDRGTSSTSSLLPAVVPSTKPTESSTIPPSQATSVENRMPQETNTGGFSFGTQKVSLFDPASRHHWDQDSFSTSMIRARHDSSSGDDRANDMPISSTNTPNRAMSVENNMAQESNAGGPSTAPQNVPSPGPAPHKPQESGKTLSTSIDRTGNGNSNEDNSANVDPVPSTNTPNRAMSVENNVAQETNAGGPSVAPQNAPPPGPAPHKPQESESTSTVRTGHDVSNEDNRPNVGPFPPTDTATRDLSVGSKPQEESKSVLSTSMARSRHDNSNEGNRGNVGIPSNSFGQNVSSHPDPSGFINPGDSKLGSMDLSKISPEAAIFCFGVLATQANFAPRFEYTYGGAGLWGIKLTFWGHTISKHEMVEGKQAAKAVICRKALEALKSQFEAWMMPDLPARCSTSTAWNWPHVLEKHCFQVGFDTPVYTKYRNGDGYRFEVEIAEASYFGMLKYYRSEGEAKNASAHLGLYSILVNNVDETSIFPGASFLRAGFANNWDEHESRVSRAPTANPVIPDTQNIATIGNPISTNGVVAGEQNVLGKNTNNAQDSTSTASSSGQGQEQLSKSQRQKRNRQTRKRLSLSSENFPPLPKATSNAATTNAAGASHPKKKQKTGGPMGDPVPMRNPNPFSDGNNAPPGGRGPTKESHPWLAKFAGSSSEKRWNVSAKRLRWQTRNCASQKERVAMICGLLALQDPEYNLDLHNSGLGAPEHFAAAFFPNDPFLARAGPVGQLRYMHKDRVQAGEECAKEVANYLIDMVARDSDGYTGGDVHIKSEPA